ncbi:MAG: hypothetical protein IPJ88_13490 [Myxococcales bacterium]|nr:MAG: hypothetical protein IPJ88_13490 [Myxococcales bacterium]
MRALAATGSARAGSILLSELKGDDIESAAIALGELRYEPAYGKLLSMLKRPSNIDFSQPSRKSEEAYRNRLLAVQALAYFDKPETAKSFAAIVEDTADDARLRANAGSALGMVANDETMSEVTRKVGDSSIEERTRVFYAQALWQKPQPTLAQAFMDLVSSANAWEVQRAAAVALGYSADTSLAAKFPALLESEKTRRAAALSLTLGADENGARKLLDALLQYSDVRDILEETVLREDTDWFNVLNEAMFKSGQIFRRIKVAKVLQEGKAEQSFSFAWAHLMGRMKAGWDRPTGITAIKLRNLLYATLTGEDETYRELAADALDTIGERGLLLAVRDSKGPGTEAARRALYRPVVGE